MRKQPRPFGNVSRIHLIGIGGAGMSGIAAVLLSMRYQISGSDLKQSDVTDRLVRQGARIHFIHKAANVAGADVVVYSAAVPSDNPEVVEARKRGIPVIPRTEMLWELMRLKFGIAVSGTHGKTTTTSMAGLVLAEAGLDPTLVVGGEVGTTRSNAKVGKSAYMVAEACEAFGEFLLLTPMISIITNIDDDHLDYYGSVERVREAFVQFANKVPFYGCVILCSDDPQVRLIASQIKRRRVTYGLGKDAWLGARGVRTDRMGVSCSVTAGGRRLGTLRLGVPGRHNLLNALAAVAVGLELNIPFATITRALARFRGVKRRFQVLGSFKGASVVDDYAHHPTAVQETLRTARTLAGPTRKVLAVFQPHLYSRTQLLRDKFGKAFAEADEVIVTSIYPSREKPIPGVTGRTLLEALRENGHKHALYVEDKAALLDYLKQHLDPRYVLVVMGAGDIWKLGHDLVEKHRG